MDGVRRVGPNPLSGKESNRLETIPEKELVRRLWTYGPLERWIDKTLGPSEIELVG